MKKFKIFLAAGLALALTSCTENFDAPSQPQSNAQEAIFAESDVTVTPLQGNPIAYDDYADSTTLIPVATYSVADGKMPKNSILKGTIEMSLTDDYAKSTTICTESLVGTDTIKVMLDSIQIAYKKKLTPSVKQKTLHMRLALQIVTDETSVANVGTPGQTFFKIDSLKYTPQYYEQTPVYYLYGNANRNGQFTAALYPGYFNEAGEYVSSNTITTYTGYFNSSSNGDLILRTQDQANTEETIGYGAETAADPNCNTLIENTSNYIKAPSAGLWTLKVDFDENKYSWTPATDPGDVTSSDIISISGDFNSWGDTDMTMVKPTGRTAPMSHNWSVVGLQITTETSGLKFRLNHAWNLSWGIPGTAKLKVDKSTAGVATSDNGQDFTLYQGTWNIYFNDITKQFYFIKVE